jgi:hypothetical protein
MAGRTAIIPVPTPPEICAQYFAFDRNLKTVAPYPSSEKAKA